MIIKALLCGCVFGWLAVFTMILDHGHSRVLDSLVQVPACGAGEVQCKNTNTSANGAAGGFFAMLAMN